MKIRNAVLSDDRKSVRMETDRGLMAVYGIRDDILRCVYTKDQETADISALEIKRGEGISLKLSEERSSSVYEDAEEENLSNSVHVDAEEENRQIIYVIETKSLGLRIDAQTGLFQWFKGGRMLLEEEKELTRVPVQVWTTGDEEPVIRRVRTVDGDRNFVENLKPVTDHEAFRAKLRFHFQEREQIHGLGQGEEGIFNYRGQTQYLYQHNMRIPMPFLLSDRGYGILADCGSLMTFQDDARGSYLFLETVPQLDYYVISGDTPAEIIRGLRFLTGKAALLPKWAFGYVQSKERYETQEELIRVAEEYRRRGVGLDCVVQDWKTWSGDRWGEKKVDASRFPDLEKMREQLHGMHVHSMVSVWPNMNYDTADCEQMRENGYLLHDLATYDAFDPEARKLYWQQAWDGLGRDGFDSWWCDSTEPFSGPDWGGETMREPWERFRLVGEEHKKFLGAERANLYANAHARGIYENQRAADPARRVLNLTRSGYAGIQKYGVALWSGDIAATWESLRTQVTEGLNMASSGIPFWTLDIGAFFVVKENWKARGCGCNEDPAPKWFWHGDFEEGLKDPAYKELYLRWLQMGVFLPMFRSHGTDVPREIWQFGEPGSLWYDAIAESIALRYRLMPYIYSLAGSVWAEDTIMQRPLFFDFPEDNRAAGADNAWMFGPALLVCPVTEPMMYAPKRKQTVPMEWNCYLPFGCDWYDFYSGERFEGGWEITTPADLTHIPLFVRAGSILPMEERLTYADEIAQTPLHIHVYPGSDGQFMYYEDSGDGYEYEQGMYNRIPMQWDDRSRTLTIGTAQHHFSGGIAGRECALHCKEKSVSFIYTGEEIRVQL